MKILHGTWIPQTSADFIQTGAFYLWVETPSAKTHRSKKHIHPYHLTAADLEVFLRDEIGIAATAIDRISDRISPQYFALPTANNQPLPSPELAKYLETESDRELEEFADWEITTFEVSINHTEGIERKGLILSTLLKLKQICNHPAQFLQDGSEFSPMRSHKLKRLSEMVEEAIFEGESLLIFSQFKEVCDRLEKYLKHVYHYNTYYIHGGTNRTKREQMIAEFQDPETEPSVFVLSLKAGGVGITLTKANYVFHFDRWWNPAVEDQATDRAFRIGQKKNVFVHKFIAMGTMEERIDQMIEDKKKLSSLVVGSDES
ncbi:DEAD/DEAH box helicase [Aerosakkonema funiforme]|uniref:DEAD/DEAH box helicase n=1 Tax=Aerosakkonema funiforme TaxID=1246630 RepID=UPI0035B7B659